MNRKTNSRRLQVTITSLSVLVFPLLSAVLSVLLAGSIAATTQEDSMNIIHVSSGDINGLYAAVYDNGKPRDNVDIILEKGTYVLDPNLPNEGRLILGENTVLRSTLEMSVDANNIPVVDENNEPVVAVEGAKIDGSLLTPALVGSGIIMVGNNGLVEKLWLVGGLRPGVVITAKGTIRKVASTGHSVGFQMRAVGREAKGTLEASLAAGNSILGISILSLDPVLEHRSNGSVEIQADVNHSASIRNRSVNLGVFGGVGATTDSKVRVAAYQNRFEGGAALGNIRIVGGQNISAPAGCNNNQVKVVLDGNFVAGAPRGLRVEGSNLIASDSVPLPERLSSNNAVQVDSANNTFESNGVDISVVGALSGTDEPGGDNNEAVVLSRNDGSALATEVFDCFPEENWLNAQKSCTNKAKLTLR